MFSFLHEYYFLSILRLEPFFILKSFEMTFGLFNFLFCSRLYRDRLPLKRNKKRPRQNLPAGRQGLHLPISLCSSVQVSIFGWLPDVVFASESKYVKQVKSFLLLSNCLEGWASEKMR